MTVFAGDDAIYTPRKGEPVRVRVWGITPKRVGIIVSKDQGGYFSVRYVKPERLERVAGGGAC